MCIRSNFEAEFDWPLRFFLTVASRGLCDNVTLDSNTKAIFGLECKLAVGLSKPMIFGSAFTQQRAFCLVKLDLLHCPLLLALTSNYLHIPIVNCTLGLS